MLLALVLLVAVAVGGLWLWGRPRAHVAMPTAATSPENVVRSYVRALDARDFATSNALGPYGDDHWWSLRAPTITGIKVQSVRAMSAQDRSYSRAKEWKQGVEVDTSANFADWGGIDDGHDQPWNYILVRNSSTDPWRILDWGRS